MGEARTRRLRAGVAATLAGHFLGAVVLAAMPSGPTEEHTDVGATRSATAIAPSPQPAPPERSPAATDATLHDTYLVRPGDVLHITVWKEPDFTGDVTVRHDGMITVPLVGDLDAFELTPRQIGAAIEEKLAYYIEEPHVTVAVAQPNSARFFAVGQVAKTGVYPLVGQMTVVQALATIGGFSTFAKKDKMFIIREGRGDPGNKGQPTILRINYKKLNKGDAKQNVVLEPGDTIVVP